MSLVADWANGDGNVVVIMLKIIVGDDVGAGLAFVQTLYFLFYSSHVGRWVDFLPLPLGCLHVDVSGVVESGWIVISFRESFSKHHHTHFPP